MSAIMAIMITPEKDRTGVGEVAVVGVVLGYIRSQEPKNIPHYLNHLGQVSVFCPIKFFYGEALVIPVLAALRPKNMSRSLLHGGEQRDEPFIELTRVICAMVNEERYDLIKCIR